jgi:hypothetical protein
MKARAPGIRADKIPVGLSHSCNAALVAGANGGKEIPRHGHSANHVPPLGFLYILGGGAGLGIAS